MLPMSKAGLCRTSPPAVKVRQFQRGDAKDVAALWKENLLLEGLTSHSPRCTEAQADAWSFGVAKQLVNQHERKMKAAHLARAISRGQVQQPIRQRFGILPPPTGTELATIMARYSSRLRRARMWSCLVAETIADPQSQQGNELDQFTSWPTELSTYSPQNQLLTSLDGQLLQQHGPVHPPQPGCTLEQIGQSASNEPAQSSNQLLGYVLLSVSQPEAALPPPFPSKAAYRLHIDGLAVARAARGFGIGTSLLGAAERLAVAWGWSSLWLHVDASNKAAVDLYCARGYRIVVQKRRLLKTEFVMCKALCKKRDQVAAGLVKRQELSSAETSSKDAETTSVQPGDVPAKVYVWENLDGR